MRAVPFVAKDYWTDFFPPPSLPRMDSESTPTATTAAESLYRGASGREYHEGKRALDPQALAFITTLRARKFQEHIQPGDVVLEFGVGAGWNLAELRCRRRLGTDVADFLAERVKSLGIEFVSAPSQLPAETADVVICHHTLEHLLEPAAALHEMARLLKPGGRLILHVPWEREWRHACHRPDEPNHHLHTWNAQTLGNFVGLCGFRVDSVRTRRYGYDRFAANQAARFHLGQTGFRLLRGLMIAARPLREVELIARKS